MVVLDHLNAVLSACHEVRRRIFVDNDDDAMVQVLVLVLVLLGPTQWAYAVWT